MDVSCPQIQCTYDISLVFFQYFSSFISPITRNGNHFTGLSCTSSRNVMEMFYLRKGCHYSLFMYIYEQFWGWGYILSFQCPGVKWQLNEFVTYNTDFCAELRPFTLYFLCNPQIDKGTVNELFPLSKHWTLMIWIKRRANNFDLVAIAVRSLLHQTYSSAQVLYPA